MYGNRLLQYIIRGYQLFISPVLGPSCRFSPSCSHYAIEALQTHGMFRGIYFTLKRLLRCHPWGSSGFDPVPNKETSYHANK